jgi:hypothetical protein
MSKYTLTRALGLTLLVLGLGFGLSACKSAADKTVESAIESTTGTDVDVDSSQNRVAVNVNGTSWETGDQVSLPANFPEDIYVVEGTLKVAIANDAVGGFTVSLETGTSVSDVKALYLKEFAADGWTITGSVDIQGSSSVMATKAKRSTTVTIGANEDKSKTIVSISTYTDTSPAAPEA